MGYASTAGFLKYLRIFEDNGIRPAASILSLGDQTVPIAEPSDLDRIQLFIDRFAGRFERKVYEQYLGGHLHVGRVYRDAGFEFASIDLNARDGSIRLDLNQWPNPDLPDRQFDVVTNEGTTEHVANQLNAFGIVHYLTKPNGIMIHEIPVLHYAAHAMVVVTPLFLKKLIDANRYEIIAANVDYHEIPNAVDYHHRPDLEFIRGFTDAISRSTIAAMGYLVLRKSGDAAYVPPLDVTLDGEEMLQMMEENIDRFGGPATEAQKEAALNRLSSRVPYPTDRVVSKLRSKQKTYRPRVYFRHAENFGRDNNKVLGAIQMADIEPHLPFSVRRVAAWVFDAVFRSRVGRIGIVGRLGRAGRRAFRAFDSRVLARLPMSRRQLAENLETYKLALGASAAELDRLAEEVATHKDALEEATKDLDRLAK